MIDPCYVVDQVKFFLNIKKYSNVDDVFFLEEKKIHEGLPDVTWLTLLIQNKLYNSWKQYLTKLNFKMIYFLILK
jgi:hypothetical protein